MPPRDPHALFLAHLPRLRAHASYTFRRVRCEDTRDDYEAETLALAWKHFLALARRGRRPELFITTLALRCSQAVKAGRRLGGRLNSRDLTSAAARRRHGVTVETLSDPEAIGLTLSDALAVDTRTPVPTQVAFRIDFPRWLRTFGRRKRRILLALAAGGRTTDAAARFNLSPGRIAQLRREFLESWRDFHAGR